ncbi:MAG TPA: LemA family protein [Flavisolibacter sp.]
MRTSPVIWIVLVLVLILVFAGCGTYNTLVNEDETVKNAWNKVQSDYQRRADLIPNLVRTVQGEANFERGTLNDVINARARATSVQVSPDNLTPENIERYQQAQAQLSGSLSRLLVTIERYPNLRANDAFRGLQTELERTENRIKVSRNDFNDAVKNYNTKVRRFPTNMFAGMFGFRVRQGFTADPGAETAPRVEFPDQQPQTVPTDTTRR